MFWKSLMQDLKVERQGAEAKIHSGRFLGRYDAVAKERFPKTYRHPDLDARLTRERLKAEARTLVRCQAAGIRTPTVYFVDPESGVLILEKIQPALTCRDYIFDLVETLPKSSEQRDLRLLSLAGEVGSVVGRMHGNGIIHGDLTTSNILVKSDDGVRKRPPQLCLIDFGLSSAEGLPEDMAVDLYVLERAMISTHPNTEFVFAAILESYSKAFSSSNPRRPLEVLKKLDDVRARGRKRTMVG